jgi:hypothetical protein
LATIAAAGYQESAVVPTCATLSMQLRAGNSSFLLAEPVAFS